MDSSTEMPQDVGQGESATSKLIGPGKAPMRLVVQAVHQLGEARGSALHDVAKWLRANAPEHQAVPLPEGVVRLALHRATMQGLLEQGPGGRYQLPKGLALYSARRRHHGPMGGGHGGGPGGGCCCVCPGGLGKTHKRKRSTSRKRRGGKSKCGKKRVKRVRKKSHCRTKPKRRVQRRKKSRCAPKRKHHSKSRKTHHKKAHHGAAGMCTCGRGTCASGHGHKRKSSHGKRRGSHSRKRSHSRRKERCARKKARKRSRSRAHACHRKKSSKAQSHSKSGSFCQAKNKREAGFAGEGQGCPTCKALWRSRGGGPEARHIRCPRCAERARCVKALTAMAQKELHKSAMQRELEEREMMSKQLEIQ